jgi:excisionase family DNA binding protein
VLRLDSLSDLPRMSRTARPPIWVRSVTCRCNILEGMTIPDVAKQIGVDEQTVRNWIRKGKLPATRWGPEDSKVIRVDGLRQRGDASCATWAASSIAAG